MDFNVIKKSLEEEYDCDLIKVIRYADKSFIKALERENINPSYRYFMVKKDNKLEEIVDNLLLAYFRENNEISEDVEY